MAGFLNQIEYHVTAVTFMVREMFYRLKTVGGNRNCQGFRVLDYGCGIEEYSEGGKNSWLEGRVYAADISPTALRYVKKAIIKEPS